MCPIDDGVIKYDRSQFELSNALNDDEFRELEKWRKTLYNLKLIGEYLPERIGYGNLSQKFDYSEQHSSEKPQFLITGTQTGSLPELNGEGYTRVLDFSFEKWSVKVKGPLEASSEALTHAAIYQAHEKIKCVFHIHDKNIWQAMKDNNYASTPASIPYGTKEMADSVIACVGSTTQGLIVMKGHEDGVISYASTLDQAGKLLLGVYDKFAR
jgi:ribulose-5-phosphate 4-epimerase/fuculose-1-phosphate aldolase